MEEVEAACQAKEVEVGVRHPFLAKEAEEVEEEYLDHREEVAAAAVVVPFLVKEEVAGVEEVHRVLREAVEEEVGAEEEVEPQSYQAVEEEVVEAAAEEEEGNTATSERM